jgi:ATP-dependent Lon protease
MRVAAEADMEQATLDAKINRHFPGLVVRKDLVKVVKGNAIVPSYVLEYLLGQYCATDDEASIASGVETVKEILRQHYVHRNEAGLVRSTIKEKGRHKVIDKISVDLNEKTDSYEASFANLGIKHVAVDSRTVKTHPKLLVSGVWSIADLEYDYVEQKNTSPFVLSSLRPVQISHFDLGSFIEARRHFTTDEWIDLLMQSIGFDPAFFGRRSKLHQLVRLIPYCERNYNLIELGPKGTGKSHIYSEFSPHGILISGGEVTVPKLFVNNASGRIGLVGYWDAVAFDEFAGKQKRANAALVDIMKNYMANKSFSRGIEMIGAEASMVFVGNTQHTVPYMLKHADLFDDLPAQYHDSAFLDRIHFYIPGWEIDIIRGQMFTNGYGFVVDYLAEILRNLRAHDHSNAVVEHFRLSVDISTRDRNAIMKTVSGLMKILYPHGTATRDEVREVLVLAMEGRKRVKDQLIRMDSTFSDVDFAYLGHDGQKHAVTTLEEQQYPRLYSDGQSSDRPVQSLPRNEPAANETGNSVSEQAPPPAIPMHETYRENLRGISYEMLFGPYLVGAKRIVVVDPYIRLFHQARNLMEFVETVALQKSDEEQVIIVLNTNEDPQEGDRQRDYLVQIADAALGLGIHFEWSYDESDSLHARSIHTDTGWKIMIDRGLDIFQYFDHKNAFDPALRDQKQRAIKAFEMTIVQQDP